MTIALHIQHGFAGRISTAMQSKYANLLTASNKNSFSIKSLPEIIMNLCYAI